MQTEKVLTIIALAVAGLLTLLFVLDLIVGIFNRNIVVDILFAIAGAFVIWQGVETLREFR
ncbi:MAG: hypothetical protein IRY99_25255 [Isosphaeraceae bacterium]|nr:hypothetical protein [Isosphaeraceae bacterium]